MRKNITNFKCKTFVKWCGVIYFVLFIKCNYLCSQSSLIKAKYTHSGIQKTFHVKYKIYNEQKLVHARLIEHNAPFACKLKSRLLVLI